jgi:hypothetical protein
LFLLREPKYKFTGNPLYSIHSVNLRSGAETDERMSNTNSWEFKDYADDADEWEY